MSAARRGEQRHELLLLLPLLSKQLPAYESVAEEVTGSVTEQVVAESVTEQLAESDIEEVAVAESIA